MKIRKVVNTFKASVERVGHFCQADSQNSIKLLRLNLSFNYVSSDISMSSSSAFVDIPVNLSSWNSDSND
jgi:hypothetical protein